MKNTGKPNRPEKPVAGHPAGTPLPSLWREAGYVLLLFGLSAVALCWLFPPDGWWPLAFVGLVPSTVACCRSHRAWLVHWLSFFVGWGFFLVSLRWLMPVPGLGYAALALYLAFYWTLAAWAIRTGRRHGIAPARLAESLFIYLTNRREVAPRTAAQALWRDWQRAGRREKPDFLAEHIPDAPGNRARSQAPAPKRQARHLSARE